MGTNLGAKAVGRVFYCGQGGGWRERSQSSSVSRGPHWPHGPTHSSLVLKPTQSGRVDDGRVEVVSSVGESVGWQNIGGSNDSSAVIFWIVQLDQGRFWTATATAVLGGSYQMVHLRQQQQLLNHILRLKRSKVKCSHSEYLLPFSQSLASHGCVVTLAVWYFYTGASTSDLCRNWHLLTTRKSSYFFSKTNTWLSSEVCTINIVCYLGAYYCTSSLLYQLVQGRWVGDSLVQASEFKHLFWSFYVWVSDDSRFFWINLFCRDGQSKTLGLLVKWSAPNELASILQNPFARRWYNFCGTKSSIKIQSCWQWIVDDPIYLLGMKKK